MPYLPNLQRYRTPREKLVDDVLIAASIVADQTDGTEFWVKDGDVRNLWIALDNLRSFDQIPRCALCGEVFEGHDCPVEI